MVKEKTERDNKKWIFIGGSIVLILLAALLLFFLIPRDDGKVNISLSSNIDSTSLVGGGDYEEGETVTIVANDVDGYIFDCWLFNGEKISNENPYTFQIDGDKEGNYEAKFLKIYNEFTFANNTLMSVNSSSKTIDIPSSYSYIDNGIKFNSITFNTAKEFENYITEKTFGQIRQAYILGGYYYVELNGQEKVFVKDAEEFFGSFGNGEEEQYFPMTIEFVNSFTFENIEEVIALADQGNINAEMLMVGFLNITLKDSEPVFVKNIEEFLATLGQTNEEINKHFPAKVEYVNCEITYQEYLDNNDLIASLYRPIYWCVSGVIDSFDCQLGEKSYKINFQNIMSQMTELDEKLSSPTESDFPIKVSMNSKLFIEGDDFSVTNISANAFDDCQDIEKVTIPNTITTIEDGAFFSCLGLEEVVLNSSEVYLNLKDIYSCGDLILNSRIVKVLKSIDANSESNDFLNNPENAIKEMEEDYYVYKFNFYKINVSEDVVEGGSIKVSKYTRIRKSEKITILVSPTITDDTIYKLSRLYYFDDSNAKVNLEIENFSFEMPSSDITLHYEFTAVERVDDNVYEGETIFTPEIPSSYSLLVYPIDYEIDMQNSDSLNSLYDENYGLSLEGLIYIILRLANAYVYVKDNENPIPFITVDDNGNMIMSPEISNVNDITKIILPTNYESTFKINGEGEISSLMSISPFAMLPVNMVYSFDYKVGENGSWETIKPNDFDFDSDVFNDIEQFMLKFNIKDGDTIYYRNIVYSTFYAVKGDDIAIDTIVHDGDFIRGRFAETMIIPETIKEIRLNPSFNFTGTTEFHYQGSLDKFMTINFVGGSLFDYSEMYGDGLGNKLFINGELVTEIEIKSNVSSTLFRNYKYLKKVVIKDGEFQIENEAFLGCINLSEVIIENTNVYKSLLNEMACGYLVQNAGTIKVLKSIVDNPDNTNTYLNNESNFTKTEDGEYYVYTKVSV